jgi:hypothetical protein
MTIIDVLKALGIDYKTEGDHHCRPGWAQIKCIWCRTGKWHLGINLRGSYCACWVCGGHRLGDTLAEAATRPIKEILTLTKDLDKGWIPKVVRPKGTLVVPKGLGPLLRAHKCYLIDRGFSPALLQRRYDVQGLGPFAGDLAWRIYIPIYDQTGLQVSWTTRSIDPQVVLRYRNAEPGAEVYPAKDYLFGGHLAGHSVVVHEGPFDAMKVGPGAVATMGVTYTKNQIDCIASYPIRAICLDNEPRAQRRAERLCSELEGLEGETYLVRIGGKDPASAPKKEIIALRKRFLV